MSLLDGRTFYRCGGELAEHWNKGDGDEGECGHCGDTIEGVSADALPEYGLLKKLEEAATALRAAGNAKLAAEIESYVKESV